MSRIKSRIQKLERETGKEGDVLVIHILRFCDAPVSPEKKIHYYKDQKIIIEEKAVLLPYNNSENEKDL